MPNNFRDPVYSRATLTFVQRRQQMLWPGSDQQRTAKVSQAELLCQRQDVAAAEDFCTSF